MCVNLKVMRQISEGLVAFLLERHDHAKPILRSIARELLSSCVLRCLISFFNPYTANKVGPFAGSTGGMHARCRMSKWWMLSSIPFALS